MTWVRHKWRASTRSPAEPRSTPSPEALSASRECPTTRRSTSWTSSSAATQEKYQLRLKYGVGDVVIWDNASLLHPRRSPTPRTRVHSGVSPSRRRNHHEEDCSRCDRRSVAFRPGAARCTAPRSSTTTTPSPRRWSSSRRSRSTPAASPSTSCCTRTVSSAWRSSTSSTWRRARRSTTPSSRRRTCRRSQGGAVHRRAVSVP